eukprot:2577154-Rhodomonas_salina.1
MENLRSSLWLACSNPWSGSQHRWHLCRFHSLSHAHPFSHHELLCVHSSCLWLTCRLCEQQVPEERNGAGGDRHFANGTSHSATSEDEEDDSTLSC